MLLSCHSWTPFAIKIIREIQLRNNDFFVLIYGFIIVNFENELKTQLVFEKVENGFTFVINDENKLCGKLTIELSEKITKEKYLYLFNTEKQRYQKLKAEDIETLHIDSAGKYLVTSKTLSGFHISFILVGIGCVAILVGVGAYIGVKKQYWFW